MKDWLRYYKVRFWFVREYVLLMWDCFIGRATPEDYKEIMDEAYQAGFHGIYTESLIKKSREAK